MSDIPPLVNDYLLACIERDLEMLKRVSLELEPVFKRKIDKVRDFSDTKVAPPCWWLYPGDMQDSLVSGAHQQVFVVNIRLVLGTRQASYDGVFNRALWTAIPHVTNFFNARKSLVYDPDEDPDPPKLLDVTGSGIALATPFGTFADNGDIGVEWQQTLPFTVYFDSQDGF